MRKATPCGQFMKQESHMLMVDLGKSGRVKLAEAMQHSASSSAELSYASSTSPYHNRAYGPSLHTIEIAGHEFV